ncbi:MAG: PTPA-CTERM sorting domain-containing protein [Leptolyngbyaceae cyanobacterium SM1_4_3]|nr:PTPA-CTERM sorting domain-containing protein [Leptolyngbyaceae cyanobacterium SM1_4_3]
MGLTIGEIKDIPSLTSFEAINNFLFFGTGSPFNFNLTSVAYTEVGRYKLTGIFADNTQATGWISTQLVDGKVNSYSATITAGNEIPTPALLPGLIGMGAAVLRKRNAEETEQAEAEA